VSSQLSLDERESRQRRAALVRDATIRLASIPGVDATVVGQAPPYGESMNFRMTPDGAPERRLTTVDVYDVGEAIGLTTYFRMMGIPFIEGRPFLPQELKDSTNAVIVSRKMAATLFPGRSAIGQHFRYLNEVDSVTLDGTVVGVVEGADGGGRDQFQLYRPYASYATPRTPVMVAFEKGAKTDPAAVQATLRSIPGLLSSETGMLDARRERALPRVLKYVKYGFAQFAIVALILAAVGTYGIVAYSVVRRTHEIGVRMALGAEQRRVTWMIVEQGLKVTAIGIIGGVAMSFLTTKLMAALIYDLRTDYPMALVAVALLVFGVSVIACWIPGARAGRLNPVDALRAE
jgi:hypothetical protein